MQRTNMNSNAYMASCSNVNKTRSSNNVEQKNVEFLRRLSNQLGGTMAGLGLLFTGIFVLFINETSIVYTSSRLQNKLSTIISVSSYGQIFQDNNNKLIHLTGKLKTNLPLTDGQFGLEAHCLKLRREIQMYQWVEHSGSPNTGSQAASEVGTVYVKEWRSDVVNSEAFVKPERHENKKEFPVKSTTYIATHAYVGSYYLKESIKENIEDFHPLPPLQSKNPGIHQMNGWYYQKDTLSHSEIGDIRARFFYCGVSGVDDNPLGPAHEVSILGKQVNGQITRFKKGRERLDHVHFGTKSAQEMIMSEMNIRSGLQWALRLSGFALLFIGCLLANSLMYDMASNSPQVQDFFVDSPIRFHIMSASCLLFLIIFFCWISVKVVFITFMFSVIFVVLVFMIKYGKTSRKASSKV